MFVLAIWLFLAGYTIAITGKRNLGLSYQPQADGSIKAVDSAGNPAKAFSLMDVIQCQEASVSLNAQPAPLGAASAPARALTPPPQLLPMPQLGPLLNPSLKVPAIPGPVPLPAPNPLPGLLGRLVAFEQSVERDVYQGVRGLAGDARSLAGGIRSALGRLPLPQVRPLP